MESIEEKLSFWPFFFICIFEDFFFRQQGKKKDEKIIRKRKKNMVKTKTWINLFEPIHLKSTFSWHLSYFGIISTFPCLVRSSLVKVKVGDRKISQALKIVILKESSFPVFSQTAQGLFDPPLARPKHAPPQEVKVGYVETRYECKTRKNTLKRNKTHRKLFKKKSEKSA